MLARDGDAWVPGAPYDQLASLGVACAWPPHPPPTDLLMTTVLVTGATGFLGRHVALADRGRLPTEAWSAPAVGWDPPDGDVPIRDTIAWVRGGAAG